MIDDAATEAAIERLHQRQEDEINRVWLALISDKAGRLILWSILERCKMMNFAHHGDRLDEIFKGRQQIGAEILQMFVFPNGMQFYTDMLLEAEQRQKDLEAQIEVELAKQEKED